MSYSGGSRRSQTKRYERPSPFEPLLQYHPIRKLKRRHRRWKRRTQSRPALRRAANVAFVAIPLLMIVAVVLFTQSRTSTPSPRDAGPISEAPRDELLVQRYQDVASRAPADARRILVVGGSTAWGFSYLTGSQFIDDSVFGIGYGHHGCDIVRGAPVLPDGIGEVKPVCSNLRQDIHDVVKGFDPQVLVVMLGVTEAQDRQVDERILFSGTPDLAAHLTEAIDSLLASLPEGTRRIVVPTVPCGEARDAVKIDWMNETVRQFVAQRPGIELAEFGAFMCPGGQPRPTDSGEPSVRGRAFTAFGVQDAWRFFSELARSD